MASLEEAMVAAHRLREGAKGLEQRAVASLSEMQRQSGDIQTLMGNSASRSGREAMVQVQTALRSTQDCVAKLQSLQRDIDALLKDLQR